MIDEYDVSVDNMIKIMCDDRLQEISKNEDMLLAAREFHLKQAYKIQRCLDSYRGGWGGYDKNHSIDVLINFLTLRKFPEPEPKYEHTHTKKQPPGPSNGVKRLVFERDEYRCVTCGTWKDLTIDHIIPRSKGGTNDPKNLQTLCRTCNSRKGTK